MIHHYSLKPSLDSIETFILGNSFENSHTVGKEFDDDRGIYQDIYSDHIFRTPDTRSRFWYALYVLRDLFAKLPIVSCLPFAQQLHFHQHQVKASMHSAFDFIEKLENLELTTDKEKQELSVLAKRVSELFNAYQDQPTTWKEWLDGWRGYGYEDFKGRIQTIKTKLPEICKMIETASIKPLHPVIQQPRIHHNLQPQDFLTFEMESSRFANASNADGFQSVHAPEAINYYRDAQKHAQQGNYLNAWVSYLYGYEKDKKAGQSPQLPSTSVILYVLHQNPLLLEDRPEDQVRHFLIHSFKAATALVKKFEHSEQYLIWNKVRAHSYYLDVVSRYPQMALAILRNPELSNSIHNPIDKRQLLQPALESCPEILEKNGIRPVDFGIFLSYIEGLENVIFTEAEQSACRKLLETLQTTNVKTHFDPCMHSQLVSRLYAIMGKIHLNGVFQGGKLVKDIQQAASKFVEAKHENPQFQQKLEELLTSEQDLLYFVGKELCENPNQNYFVENLQDAFEYLSSIDSKDIHYARAMRLCGDLILTQTDMPKSEASRYYMDSFLKSSDRETLILYLSVGMIHVSKESEFKIVNAKLQQDYEAKGYTVRCLTTEETYKAADSFFTTTKRTPAQSDPNSNS